MPPESPAIAAAHPSGPPQPDPEYRILDLARYLRRMWRRRYFIVLASIGGALLGYGSALLQHPRYDATVRLMPPNNPRDNAIASFSPSRNEGDLYLGLISSRTVADEVIEQQHLADYFHTTRPSELRRDLAGMAKFSVDKDQFVTVVVRATEPETAMRVANAFPEALSRQNRTIAQSQAQHRLEYIAGPLEQEKVRLAQAEDDLRAAEQQTGMVMPQAQVELGLSAISSLKQQITSRQEQLAALETSSTDQNPQVIQLKSQIASLSGQLGRLQAQNGGSGGAAPSAKTPALTLEIERKQREVKFHETLFELLSRQSENASVEESYAAPIELVDAAVLPDEKSWPSRRLFFLGGLLAGALLATVYACGRP